MVKPEVSITWPCQLSVLTNSDLVISGKTRGESVTDVFYQLNGGDWMEASTADNWLDWAAQVTPKEGVNTIRAYAIDSFGDTSRTAATTFFFQKNFRQVEH
jgi:hypothetical protein